MTGLLTKLFHREPKQQHDDIVGYDDIKRLLSLALKSVEPVHIAFIGPPASAKTMFLLDIFNKHRSVSHFVDGTDTTKVGLRDVLQTPGLRILIIDEIDKLARKDQAILLNVMETGILSTTVHKKIGQRQIKVSVFATINNESKVMLPLRSRFQKLILEEYTEAEFMDIGTTLLGRNGIDIHMARMITSTVWNEATRDIREVLRLGRMIKAMGDKIDINQVKDVVRTCIKYGAPKE